MQTLYLASQSYSRHMLLKQAGIPFTPIGHHADEQRYNPEASIYDIVLQIAHHKMDHVEIPEGVQDQTVFVLSADTLSVDSAGVLRGKPRDYNDAVEKIRAARDGSTVCTGFCLRKLQYVDAAWNTIEEHAGAVSAYIVIDIPDDWIDAYLMNQPYALQANGAVAVEGYGMQFLRRITGSYTSVVGLPLYEIRTALDDLGFYQ